MQAVRNQNAQDAMLTSLYNDAEHGKRTLRALAGLAAGVLVFFAAITLYDIFFVP